MFKILFLLLGILVLNKADGTFGSVSTEDLSNFDDGKEVEVPDLSEAPYGNDVTLQKRSNSDKLMRRSSLDKNFMRFGRSGFREGCCKEKDFVWVPEISEYSNGEETFKKPNSIPLGRRTEDNFIRFGRSKSDNFMRFGRDDSFMRFGRGDKDNFMRFGRGDKGNFMRFGRGNDNFMRFGRGNDNFMRFGRGNDNFMRFGRGNDNFMRFGRGNDNFMRFGRGNGNFMRFGKKDGEEPDEMSTDNFYPSMKGDNTMRFGKNSKNDGNFLRFGKSDGKGDSFIRFGRNGTNFLRFGRGSSEETNKVDDSVDAEADASENSAGMRRKRMVPQDLDRAGNNKFDFELPENSSN